MSEGAILVEAGALRGLVAAIFRAKGMAEADAETLADVLVWANLRGVDSHGVMRVPRYLEFLARGDLDPRAQPVVARRTGGALLLDARHAAGPVAMLRATEAAIDAVRTAGVALTVVAETTHTGAIGYYANHAAMRGYAALVMAAGPPFMAYHGARVPSLATSPIAIAVPRDAGPPLLLDMATAVAAMGRINAARQSGDPIPEGWALDDAGEPTTDAAKARVLLPIGGAKGSGLALLMECLTGVMTGAPILTAMLGAAPSTRHWQNALVVVIDIAALRPVADFRRDTELLARTIKGLPRRAGCNEILLPGERGERMAGMRRASGIPVPAKLWSELAAIAAAFSLVLPAARRSD